MKNIRKNSKLFKTETAGKKTVKCFTLANCFKGEIVEIEFSQETLSRTILSQSNGKFVLHIHNNKWFEWPIAQQIAA